MFFEEIKLSTKSWHYRLQSWMFCEPPFEDNFCPYFWLTIFCLFIAPFVAVVKFFPVFFGWLLIPFNVLSDVIEQHICKPMIENRIRSLSDSEVYFASRYSDHSYATKMYEK